VSDLHGIYAYGTVFGVLLACGLGLPMPEDITLVIAGYLSFLENIELVPAIAVCMVGVLAGDVILFMLGRIYGKKIIELPVIRWAVTPRRLAIATEKLKTNSKKVCFIARFMAGLRAPIYLSAGIAGVKLSTFLILDFLAALISVPLWVYLGYYFGDEIDVGFHYARRAEKYILIGLALLGLYFLIRKLLQTNLKTKG
jgi:membrane protein DedA with SNARE-associated domain